MRKFYSFLKVLSLTFMVIFSITQLEVYSQNCSVNAGTTQTICENATLTLTGQKSGLFQGAGTITWSQIAGPQ